MSSSKIEMLVPLFRKYCIISAPSYRHLEKEKFEEYKRQQRAGEARCFIGNTFSLTLPGLYLTCCKQQRTVWGYFFQDLQPNPFEALVMHNQSYWELHHAAGVHPMLDVVLIVTRIAILW